MKPSIATLLLTALSLTVTGRGFGEEARRIDASETSAFEIAPVAKAPKYISKSMGPVVEKSREYFSKGAMSAKSAVVRINLTDGTVKEQPYVEVPLFFRVGTAELVDENSKANVQTVLLAIRNVLKASPDARFRVEGHASKEGDALLNERLSRQRAEAIQLALGSRLGSEGILSAEGRGTKDAQAEAGDPESRRRLDRKVLVVREQ